MELFAGVAVVICKNTFAGSHGLFAGLVEVFLLLKKGSQLFFKRFYTRFKSGDPIGAFLMRAEVSDGCDMWLIKVRL